MNFFELMTVIRGAAVASWTLRYTRRGGMTCMRPPILQEEGTARSAFRGPIHLKLRRGDIVSLFRISEVAVRGTQIFQVSAEVA